MFVSCKAIPKLLISKIVYMIKLKYLALTFLLVFVSCSKDDNSCPCVRTNGSEPFLPDGEVDEGYCTGEIENLSQNVLYQRICDY